MGKPHIDPLEVVEFRCPECSNVFEAPPDETEPEPAQEYHPWYYTARCPAPGCPGVCEQSPRSRGLLKAWATATGPRTESGKAKSSANLDGHPTPEEAKRTRFNAMKTGAHAKVAQYFPAKPGNYANCETCDYFGDVCIKNPPAHHENPVGCLKKAEVYIAHRVAFDGGDPGVLRDMRADTQAGLQVIIDEMILQIAQDGGPRIKELTWYHDKDGGFHLARYRDEQTNEFVQIYESKAHPLLKPLIDFISKNSLTLADMGMTPKVQQENELLAGHLQHREEREQDALQFQARQQLQMEALRDMISNGQKRTEQDSVLIEYNQGAADG